MRSDFKLLEGSHPELEHWHGNVGEAVALDLAGPLVRGVTGIDVVNWNVGIGLGRLTDVVAKLKAGVFDGEVRSARRPLVMLVQEAYRADNTIPERARSAHTGGKSPRRSRLDIVEMAHELGMSLRYAPSMRNGRHRSDRGNAILASVEIAHARSFALPHVRQRRIAVAAELQGMPWLTLVSAHLDTRGRPHGQAARMSYAAGRTAQANELGRRLDEEWGSDQTVLIGADLNSFFGSREPLLARLAAKGFRRVAHEGRSRHTFHAPALRMLLDHILLKEASGSIADIRVTRLDESSSDRERYIFGSDHHPLLARIEFAPMLRRIKRTQEK